jgi:hypothetical protein
MRLPHEAQTDLKNIALIFFHQQAEGLVVTRSGRPEKFPILFVQA